MKMVENAINVLNIFKTNLRFYGINLHRTKNSISDDFNLKASGAWGQSSLISRGFRGARPPGHKKMLNFFFLICFLLRYENARGSGTHFDLVTNKIVESKFFVELWSFMVCFNQFSKNV